MAKKPTTTTAKELATASEAGLPALAFEVDLLADVGAGMEGADKDSFAIPFLGVLQKISPQVDEADAKYIEGAKGGQLFNTVTQQLFDGKEGVLFIPCAFQRRFLRWGPRGGENSGFKGELFPEAVAEMRQNGDVIEHEGRLYFPMEDGKFDEKRCDRLSDTRNHFGVVYDPETETAVQVLLSLSSTQIKKSKQLMAMLSAVKVSGPKGMVTPPTWSNVVRLTTVAESNDKGSWYGLKITPEGFVPNRELYDLGKAFHELITAGEGVIDYAQADAAEEAKPGF